MTGEKPYLDSSMKCPHARNVCSPVAAASTLAVTFPWLAALTPYVVGALIGSESVNFQLL